MKATPTDVERAALKRIASVRTWLAVILFASVCVLMLALQIRDSLVAMILSGLAVFTLLALVVYASFCLRCPRCSGWIPMPSSRSRCTSCGLRLAAAGEEGADARKF